MRPNPLIVECCFSKKDRPYTLNVLHLGSTMKLVLLSPFNLQKETGPERKLRHLRWVTYRKSQDPFSPFCRAWNIDFPGQRRIPQLVLYNYKDANIIKCFHEWYCEEGISLLLCARKSENQDFVEGSSSLMYKKSIPGTADSSSYMKTILITTWNK